ncbi:hypothetical protein Nepgr_028509 [Nepenthes gracilis]|uniref:Uncharacterized protein n=1 Tax=Nepenthes gracilis TaxID=150966 RepID=A0AAD3TCN9_NEPGR|nr:hypothetical protein Nepgr_028509 [Nepenthes gracilis]
MMNSIFSPFEMYAAEVLGHKIDSSTMVNSYINSYKYSESDAPKAVATVSEDSREMITISTAVGDDAGPSSYSSPAPGSASETPPLFSLESDGLN